MGLTLQFEKIPWMAVYRADGGTEMRNTNAYTSTLHLAGKVFMVIVYPETVDAIPNYWRMCVENKRDSKERFEVCLGVVGDICPEAVIRRCMTALEEKLVLQAANLKAVIYGIECYRGDRIVVISKVEESE